MFLDDFYSSITPEMAKTVFGEKAHFHWGAQSQSANPFDQAVIDIFPYIKKGSKVLDCGCGWGGPGRMFQEQLNCDVTGVTISKVQADYSNQFFPTYHADLHNFKSDQHYDVAIFFESYFHLEHGDQVLKNLQNNVDQIIIKDFTVDVDGSRALPAWYGKCRSKDQFFSEIESAGFTVKEFKNPLIENYYQDTMDHWIEGLKKLNLSRLPMLMNTVQNLCIHYQTMKNLDDYTSNHKDCRYACTIHAIKNVS